MKVVIIRFLYGFTILLGAFLLFQVQPLIGKYLLPWFGNSPSMWGTCLLFFQVMLLGGYVYAHLLSNRLKLKPQIILHSVILLAAVYFLPIIPSADLKPDPEASPEKGILLVLGSTIAIPYLLLSATSPLLQRWHSLEGSESSTWRLYAVSNTGSLLALLTYPFVIEPFFKLKTQLLCWSGGFCVYIGLLLLLSVLRWRTAPAGSSAVTRSVEDVESKSPEARPVSVFRVLIWLVLSASASALLVATTNRIGQDVPAVPFLFILPLCLYLITFIIAFDSPRWYVRPLFCGLLPLAIAGAWYEIFQNVDLSITSRIGFYSFAVFVCCQCCHGELARTKPPVRHLTFYYLIISVGGALGGVFSSLLAPLLYDSFLEYPLALLVCFTGVMGVVIRDLLVKSRQGSALSSKLAGGAAVYSAAGVLLLSTLLTRHFQADEEGLLEKSRNFYGVLKIFEANVDNERTHKLKMYHGEIHHGSQYLHPEKRVWKISYYGEDSGVGIANRYHSARRDLTRQFRIGVIGLGTGSMSAWANHPEDREHPPGSPLDAIHFYEIDPQVISAAETHFSYLADARERGGTVEVSLGDARSVMEQALDEGRPQNFDLLVVDAFSGDSIPMHLLTRECFEIYRQHLATDGIVAFHVSSRYLDLRPVIQGLGDEFGFEMRYVYDEGNDLGCSQTRWALLTKNRDFLKSPLVKGFHLEDADVRPVLWTDDYSSLTNVLD